MRHPFWRLCVFLLVAAFPVFWLYQAWIFALGPDPGKILLERLGTGALILLLLTLSMTPLQKVTGWSGWLSVRRQLGLWCFVYGLLHFAAYAFFILGLEWGQLAVELRKRPYIVVGALALFGLLPLAMTSNRYSQRRMGASWKKLHRLIYPLLLLVLLHMLWVVRADLAEWVIYAALGVLLLVLRIPAVMKRIPRNPWRRSVAR